jgi:hypothetical protein
MSLNDEDMTTTGSGDPEGPADGGATVGEHDGAADGAATADEVEGTADAGAAGPGEAVVPGVEDGGADSGAGSPQQ